MKNPLLASKIAYMKLDLILVLGMLLITKLATGQNFQLMRYDEDYSRLKDSAKTFCNKIKYIQLSEDRQFYLSLGGEVRGELNYAMNEDWGEMNVGQDVFFLQRYQLHTDFHFGERLRIFGQLRSGLEDGRTTGPRRIDEDKLNVQNLFIDFIPYRKVDESLVVRLGRQELRYGSGRLIDAREGPNLRLYFDGAKIAYKSPNLKIDAFVMADGIVNTGIFDNSSTRKPNLWGIYNTYISPKSGNFDLYYLGINRKNAKFDAGIAEEIRHTLGMRFWRNKIGFGYNFEAGYQFGTFGSGTISALAISSEIGYIFKYSTRLPSLKLKSDYITGTKNPYSNKLGTFNAMYPNGGYFGMNPQAGPANLISVHPNLNWHPANNILLTLDVVFNWRNSLNDGVYGPSGSLSLSALNSKKRYIGTAYITTLSWNVKNFLSYNIGVQYFKTGSVINDVIQQHKNGFFVGSTLGIKF
ncbi:alginate export family protein [Sphingobacterium prati]